MHTQNILQDNSQYAPLLIKIDINHLGSPNNATSTVFPLRLSPRPMAGLCNGIGCAVELVIRDPVLLVRRRLGLLTS